MDSPWGCKESDSTLTFTFSLSSSWLLSFRRIVGRLLPLQEIKKKSFSVPFAEKLISPCRKGPSFQKTGGLPSSRTMRRGLRTLGRMKVKTVSWISVREVNRPFLGRPAGDYSAMAHASWRASVETPRLAPLANSPDLV